MKQKDKMSWASKPDWKDAPDWAEWLAQDFDGAWYWYEKQPVLSEFIHGLWSTVESDVFANASAPDLTAAENWRESLERRRREE